MAVFVEIFGNIGLLYFIGIDLWYNRWMSLRLRSIFIYIGIDLDVREDSRREARMQTRS